MDTSDLDAALDQTDEEILMCEVSDEALEAAAGATRLWTAMVTDCPTLIAACCGDR
ncbi:MAG: hypothetical protein AB7S93_14985 [Xanthobacteraceae bacterium]